MDDNLARSSISVVLNKIELDDFDSKALESYDDNTNSNEIYSNMEQPELLDNQNNIEFNEEFEKKLTELNTDMQVKPSHWISDYWDEILKKYNWFLHKNNYIGCKICYNIKSFMGKRSLLGTMKLFLMDLTYEELELKLSVHNFSIQHKKSISLLKVQLGLTEIEIENIEAVQPNKVIQPLKHSRPIDHYCPLCKKGYRIKKALSRHIYNCNNEQPHSSFNPPCKCDDQIVSFRAIDEHNVKFHSNNLLFVCKFCSMEFKQTTVLFGHLLSFHDFYWNPYEELPGVIEKPLPEDSVAISSSNRPERKKSLANSISDNIYIVYGQQKDYLDAFFAGQRDHPIGARKPHRRPYHKSRQPMKEKPDSEADPVAAEIRIERVLNTANNEEVSKLTISQSSIFTCEYCGGRYLSIGILNAHMANYHLVVPKAEQNQEERRRRRCLKRLNKLVNNYPVHKNSKSNYIRISSHMRKVRALQMKKKLIQSDHSLKIGAEIIRKKIMRHKVSAAMLSCPACQQRFDELDARSEHVSRFHPELEKFSCKICGLIFTNLNTYQSHMTRSHDNESGQVVVKQSRRQGPDATYSCDNCHLVFTNQADLSRHFDFSHATGAVAVATVEKPDDVAIEPAPIDEATVPPVTELTALIEADYSEEACPCPSCDTVLANPFELVIHSLSHRENGRHGDDFQICPHCSRLFFGSHRKTYLKDHYGVEHLNKPAPQCTQCKSQFSSSFVLEQHQIDSTCRADPIIDPYLPLMAEEKLAFCCSQCCLVFAGEKAKLRFDNHVANCSFELMDSELLNS